MGMVSCAVAYCLSTNDHAIWDQKLASLLWFAYVENACACAGVLAGQGGGVQLQPLSQEGMQVSVIIVSPDNTMDLARRLVDEGIHGEKAHADSSDIGSRDDWAGAAKGA